MKHLVALALGLMVALHQIPGRRILLQTIWDQSEQTQSLNTNFDSLNSETIKKTPHSFRRCRPCVVKKINLDRPIDVANHDLPIDCNAIKSHSSSLVVLAFHLQSSQASSAKLTRAPPVTPLI